jgi:hypothetical protein
MTALSVAVPHAAAQEPLSEEGFGFFYDSLVPHGDWIQVADYGPCWRPATDEDWAPYTDGYWAYTDVGWTWVSHEPFGSIVYHYGRWLLSDRGWCWVPGADWSPAWVSWRAGQDYIGWAPLPPEVPWHPQRGISTWVDVHTEIGPAYYRFCSVRDFSAPVLSGVLLRPSRNAVIMVRTENVTQIVVRNSNVYCGGPGYDWVSGRVSGRVPLLRVAREENISRFRSLQPSGGGVQNIVHNNILVLPAPKRVDFGSGLRNVPAPAANLSFSKGWYSNSAENERLRSHLAREWEQRRATPAPSTIVKDPNGGTVRLTSPSTEEKKAVLNEIASNPAMTPTRREKDPRAGDERTTQAPKAVPVQTPSTPVFQKSGGVPGSTLPAAGAVSGGGLSRPVTNKTEQTGTPNPEEPPAANLGTSRTTPSSTGVRTSPRAVSMDLPQRNSFGSVDAAQNPSAAQTPRRFPSQTEFDSTSRVQPKPASVREPSTVGGGFGSAIPGRSSPDPAPGFTQAQPVRSGAGFSQPTQSLPAGVVVPRGAAPQAMSSGVGVRSTGVTQPVQTMPTSRSGQPASVAEQAGRPRGGGGQPSQTAPSFPAPAGVSGAGGGAGRPQSVSSGPGVAPAAPTGPASPAGAGPKKKPGDPGYVPGTP